ncbi:hypothetical protein [Tepidibacillus marianensis]|uniref:hypothetical protein n=1 Tax=Tepidibacillus marianensis TaxID=3131995 RepID=UPI0030CA6395
MDKTIYNYKLIRRFRKTPLWLSGYLLFFLSILFVPYHKLQHPFFPTFILILVSFYFSYLFWNLLSLWRIKGTFQVYFSLLPWFGIVPKRMLSTKEYKQYEIIIFTFSSLHFLWMIVLIPKPFYLIAIALFILLIGYRFYFFTQTVFIYQAKDWVKYERFGLSVYQTDSF